MNSYGDLNYFRAQNAPSGATKKCIDCPHSSSCRYNAQHFYLDPLPFGWSKNVLANPNVENVTDLLANTNYGSCVYQIEDNDVCDHQVALIKFKNGINATFTVTAFNQNQKRFTRIMGTEGSIVADTEENTITITKHIMHVDGEQSIEVIKPKQVASGHGGGDLLIMKDFAKLLREENHKPRTDFNHAMQSHYMAYDIEQSRVKKQVIKRK